MTLGLGWPAGPLTPTPPFPSQQVEEVVGGTDVICSAKNDALLDGLLTVFHVERSTWGGWER